MEISKKEQDIFGRIFKGLEERTEKFTIDNSVCIGNKSASPESKIIHLEDDFKGFSINPSKYLNEMLHERYPGKEGTIIYYLMDNIVGYLKNFKFEFC